MAWVASAIVGSSLIGGISASNAASDQAGAANRAAGLSHQEWLQNKQDIAPWLASGGVALGKLGDFMNAGPQQYQGFQFDPNKDPLYQWQLSQGLDAVANKASALGGGLNSGTTLKSLNDYAQNQAMSAYQTQRANWQQDFLNQNTLQNNYWDRIMSLSNTGANAALGQAGIGQQVAGQMGSDAIAAANARAAGTMGVGNALTSGIGMGLNYYQQQQMMNALAGGGAAGGFSQYPGGWGDTAMLPPGMA